MKILIPPSEGKARVKATNEIFSDTNFKFERAVTQVVRLLELIDDEDLRSVYGTSPEKALGFHRQNQDIFNSPCAPAIERYTGVVYEHIEWTTLSEKAKIYMEKYVFIFSGLFGMVTPMTPIPDYKLKMNVLSLQHHWNPILSKALQDEKKAEAIPLPKKKIEKIKMTEEKKQNPEKEDIKKVEMTEEKKLVKEDTKVETK